MSDQFGKLKRLSLREAWSHEALEFTPWLEENIGLLNEALGLELEVKGREENVGDFSVDLLAEDLNSQKTAIIENQLEGTDHSHLGQLVTYAAGYGAGIVIWISESIREEHRQALEWLNEHSTEAIAFFGVIVEALQIEDSPLAINFRSVVAPNEWQKQARTVGAKRSERAEAYREFFQPLIDELREDHRFTNAKQAQPQSWHAFSSGLPGVGGGRIHYGTSFAKSGLARVEVYLDMDRDTNKAIFDNLFEKKEEIEREFGSPLSWERLDDKKASRIAIYSEGSIDEDEASLAETKRWFVDNLLRFQTVFEPHLRDELQGLWS